VDHHGGTFEPSPARKRLEALRQVEVDLRRAGISSRAIARRNTYS